MTDYSKFNEQHGQYGCRVAYLPACLRAWRVQAIVFQPACRHVILSDASLRSISSVASPGLSLRLLCEIPFCQYFNNN